MLQYVPVCCSLPTLELYLIYSQISIHSNYSISTHKKRSEASGANQILQPLPVLNLRPTFHAIAEGENHPTVRIDRCVIHKPVEQLLVKIHRQLFRFAKPRKEAAEKVILDSFPLPLLYQYEQLLFY